ncbi:MAG TPA: hypothetical protein DER58_08815 [Firmicutes bacterium]|nr:hypothetical protein [Bacillota bacterium]
MEATEKFFRQIKKKAVGQPWAVCLGAGHGGTGVIRGLGRAGINVMALGINSIDFGLSSKYCIGINLGEEQWSEKMLLMLERIAGEVPGKKVLFPDNDKFADFIYLNSERLSPDFVWLMPPDLESYRSLSDKTHLVDSAAKAGVPFPKTVIPSSSEDLRKWCDSSLFPIVIKPINSPAFAAHFKRKGFIADNMEEAIRFFKSAADAGFETIAQELIPGGIESLITVYLYRSRRGKTIVSFVGKKVRQYPVDLGTASLYVSEAHPEAVILSKKLLDLNDYQGIADVEFKKDSRDGLYKVIEVNGRVPMFSGIERGTGIPLSVHIYNDLAGKEALEGLSEPLSGDRTRWLYAAKDAIAALSMLRKKELSLFQAVHSHFAGPKTYAIWAVDDPGPGFAFLKYLLEDARAYAKKRKVI